MDSLQDFAEKYYQHNAGGQNAGVAEFDFCEAVGKAAQPLLPFPQGMARDCVRAWLTKCEDARQLIDRGTATQRFQVPREHLSAFLDDHDAISDLSVPREVARFKTVLCGHQLNRGESVLAARTATNLLDIVKMVLHGDGYLIHFLVALAVHATCMELVHAFTLHPGTSRETLDNMRSAMLQIGPTTDALARTFRMETTHFMTREVSRLAQTGDLRALIDLVVERNYAAGGLTDNEEVVCVKRGMFQLFDGHACPFDAAETVELYSGAVVTLIDDLPSAWLRRCKHPADAVLEQLKPWPRSLWYINDLVLVDSGDEATQAQSLPAAQIADAGKALRAVHNPIGKLMLHHIAAFDNVRRAFHLARLKTDVALVLIACRLYRDAQHRMPRALSELVAAGLLGTVPIDPFSGGPLGYDADRGVLWSAGCDAADDSIQDKGDAAASGAEKLIWQAL